MEQRLLSILALATVCCLGGTSHAASRVVAWGGNGSTAGETNVPPGLTNAVAVSGGSVHSLALQGNGVPVAWGNNSAGQGIIPTGLGGIMAIEAGHSHNLALTTNGLVVGWGLNSVGQAAIPPQLKDVVRLAAGNGHNVVLLKDGTVTAWGANSFGQALVPPSLNGVAGVGVGLNHSLAVLSNGTVVAWGNNSFKQAEVPSGLSNVVAVTGGSGHSLALRRDGSVVAWGANGSGQTNVPAGLNDAVEIAAGSAFSMALRRDGTVVAWGSGLRGETNLPAGLSNVFTIAAGHFHGLAIVGDGAPDITDQPANLTVDSGRTATFAVQARGPNLTGFQWQRNGSPIPDATNRSLTLPNVQLNDAGAYSVVVSNSYGTATSAEAVLVVLNRPPSIATPPVSQMVSLGGTATFEVSADGSLPQTYTWKLNGTNLDDATGRSLVFTNLAFTDAGTIEVTITNAFGAVTSSPVQLIVMPPPFPGTIDQSFDAGPDANGVVRAVAIQPGGKIVVGGWFSRIAGVQRPFLTRLNRDGSHDPSFVNGTGPNGAVLAITTQSDGKLIIAGEFTSVDSVPSLHVARLLPNGSVDRSFDSSSGPSGSVWAVAAQSDGKIWIGGDFQTVGGMTLRNLARLHPNGGVDSSVGTASSPDGFVQSLALDRQGRILVGGSFGTIGATAVQRIARLETNGFVDATFSVTFQPGSAVQAIAVQADNRIVIGGFFNVVYGITRNHLARLMEDGQLDGGFNAEIGLDGGVSSIATLPDGQILIGGGFSTVYSRPRGRIARLHPNGRLDGTFESDPGADNWIEDIALDENGDIVIGGAFNRYAGLFRPYVARIFGRNPPPFPPIFVSTAADQTVKEGVNLQLSAQVNGFPEPSYQWRFNDINISGATNDNLPLRNIRFPGSGIYSLVAGNSLGVITGAITRVTVIPAPTHPGSVDIDFYAGSGAAGAVHAIQLQPDRRILIAGSFMTIDGVPQVGVARLNANGSRDNAFSSRHGYARSIALVADGRLMVGGYLPASVARLFTTGEPDPTFVPVPSVPDFVYSVALQSDGRILTAATTLDSQQAQVRRYETTGVLDSNFVVRSTSPGGALAMLVQPDNKILVGGLFTDINDVFLGRLVRLNTDGTLDPSFNAGAGANERVNAIARQQDGKILIAGQFTRVNGVLRNRIARLNTNGSVDPTFNPGLGPNEAVNGIAVAANGQILVAGRFTSVSGIERRNVARLNADGSVDPVFHTGIGPDEQVHTIVIDPEGGVLIGGEFVNVDGVPRAGIARLRGGGPSSVGPVIVHPPTNQVVSAGEDLTFTVLATAEPTPTYQWQFNGMDIPGANHWILTVPNVRSTNGGAYRVIISNTLGTVTSSNALANVLVPSRTAGKPDIDFYTGSGPNETVTAIVPLPDGGIIIGGAFTEFAGTPRGRIARLARNGSLDTMFASGIGANATVNALALQPDGKLIVGGAFGKMHGIARNRIARLNIDGTLDANFDPGDGPNGDIFAAAVLADNQILVGGAFGVFSGRSNAAIARLSATGTVDTSFGAPFRAGSSVRALGFQRDRRIIVGGTMIDMNGFFTALTRLSPDGQIDPTYQGSFGLNAGVLALTVRPDDHILVGGYFGGSGGVTRLRVAQLTPNGSLSGGFDPALAASNVVRAIALQGDGRTLIGGDFTGVSGTVLNRIARLTTNGLVDATFQPGTGVTGGTRFTDEYGELIDQTSVQAIAIEAGGSILIGGDFTKVNEVTRPGLARLYDRQPLSTIRIRPLPGASVELFWEVGVLQQAPDLSGPWTDVARAAGTYEVSLQGELRFYRLRLN